MADEWYPEHIALHTLLKNLSAELLAFAESIEVMEDKVGGVIETGALRIDQLSVQLQGLDHLAQTANELAIFVGTLARSIDVELTVSVIDQIKEMGLRSLVEGLTGHSSQGDQSPTVAGEVDLFLE